MALMQKNEYEDAPPAVRAVYDDMRAGRKTEYINDIRKVNTNDPVRQEHSWTKVRDKRRRRALDALTKELIYVAISMTNDCTYCINTHTASARAKGMTDAQFGELLAVVGLANQMNKIVAGTQVELDEKYRS